jgi:hypothetical protein
MKVINPETKTEVRHFSPTFLISKKKKAEAAIIAIVPTKKVKAVACSIPSPWVASNKLEVVVDKNIAYKFDFSYSLKDFQNTPLFQLTKEEFFFSLYFTFKK